MNTKKKVIFCTYSSIYSSIVLEQLVANQDIDLVAIVNSTRVLRPSLNSIQGAISHLKISGLRYSTYLFLITDFFKWIQPLLFLRKKRLRHIHDLAQLKNIPIINTKDINTIESIEFIEEKKPEVIVCAHFNQLLKAPAFALEEVQFINIHPSILPNYKGVDPVFFAMKNNVNEIGVTLHKMNESFDAGEIISQSFMKVDKTKTLFFNNCKLFNDGAKLAITWIKSDDIGGDAIKNNGKDNTNMKNYDSWPNRDDVKGFIKSGRGLITLSALWKQQ